MRGMEIRSLQRVRRAYDEGGPGLVLRKALGTFTCEVVLYAFDLDQDLAAVASDLPLEIRALSDADVDTYLELRPDEAAINVRTRLARGDVSLVSWSGAAMIGGVWARFDKMWVSELGTSLPLEPGEAYGYASFTDPQHRARGSASVLYVATLRHLLDMGYRRVLAYVLAGNEPGRAALEKVMFVPIGRMRWFHVGRYGVVVLSREGERSRVGPHFRSRRAAE
jgi:GNAT superfamily N-acetyltransferase